MKSYTAGQQSAIGAEHAVCCLLIEADLPTGARRYTTAGATIKASAFDPGTLSLDWIGGVSPTAIAPIRETENNEAVGLEITLSGVSSSQRSLALAQHVQGRRLSIWVAPMSATTYALEGTPVKEWEGLIDVLRPSDSAEGVLSLAVEVETRGARLLRPNLRRYTDADHQSMYPGDTICRWTSQSERTLVWPSAALMRSGA